MLIAAILTSVSSLVASPFTHSTLDYNDEELLFSKPVLAGLIVPEIYFLICVLACFVPVVGIVVQSKPWFPAFATKVSVAIATPTAALAVWFAYNSLTNYCGELIWMNHD